MTISPVLVTTHHDPEGLLYDQTIQMVPRLQTLYSHIVAVVTPVTAPRSRDLLRSLQITVIDDADVSSEGLRTLGTKRRLAVEQGLHKLSSASHIHLCDFDRVLHWAEFYPDELRTVLETSSNYDFTVLGRTPRAFDSHPRVQCDTEAIINHVFYLASTLPWDVTAASRVLSRRAAEILVERCRDDTIGVDCSWPLCMQQQGNLTMHYIETEGLEFETLDRYRAVHTTPDADAAWMAQLDGDPQHWLRRLDAAYIEVQAVVTYRKR